MRLTRNDIKRHSALLEIPLGDPQRYGQKRDFVGDFVGGVADAVGDVVSGVGDAVGDVVSGVGDALGSALPILSSVAAAIPGPWQIPALIYNTANAASQGNVLGMLGGAVGLSGVGGATSWFDAPITDAAAMEAFTSMPLEAQNAYFNAGMSPLEVGKALAQDQSYLSAFSSLPADAQQAYIDAGMNPSSIGSGLMTDQARNTQLWGQLPADAQQAYIDAGYTPDQIGGMLASDATINAGNLVGAKTAYDATKTINKLFGGGGSGTGAGMLGTGATALASYLSKTAGQDAATKTAAAQIQAAQIAADAAKFRPVGVTTNFGASKFGYDASGNLSSAGYTLSPQLQAQQDSLMGISNTMLGQYNLGQAAALPMGQAGQRAMSLGNQYLAADPQAQAQKYMQDQQALLATGRERDVNNMLTGEFNRGTYGLSTGATSTGMMGANPRLEAMYNAQRQQDLGLAAQATQGGMDYAKFGAALTGTGGDLLNSMYRSQSAAYDPYKTALGGAAYIEGLGQQPLDMGVNIGAKGTAGTAQSGILLSQGMNAAAQTQQAASGNPWANALGMLGSGLQQYGQPQQQQQQYQFNPFTGARL